MTSPRSLPARGAILLASLMLAASAACSGDDDTETTDADPVDQGDRRDDGDGNTVSLHDYVAAVCTAVVDEFEPALQDALELIASGNPTSVEQAEAYLDDLESILAETSRGYGPFAEVMRDTNPPDNAAGRRFHDELLGELDGAEARIERAREVLRDAEVDASLAPPPELVDALGEARFAFDLGFEDDPELSAAFAEADGCVGLRDMMDVASGTPGG